MPDVHWGMGATIGSVIATKGAIVPAAVGVDIGCGMMAYQTSLKAQDLPDNLHNLRCDIERNIPHGRTDNGGRNDKGSSQELSACNQIRWGRLSDGYNKIGMYFIEKAKKEMERWHIDKYLVDKDLSYLVENTEIFDDYIEAVQWAQDFALENRKSMMQSTLAALSRHTKHFEITEMAVNCHHNYIAKENHFGSNVWITRKGAVRARAGDLGIIPGSMGTGSFIVTGLGNKHSFCSCSHGAGRVMSRGQAKKEISIEQHANAMHGIEARLDSDVLDESPAAYKDIGAVMEAQTDLVEILFKLKQVLNVKG